MVVISKFHPNGFVSFGRVLASPVDRQTPPQDKKMLAFSEYLNPENAVTGYIGAPTVPTHITEKESGLDAKWRSVFSRLSPFVEATGRTE